MEISFKLSDRSHWCVIFWAIFCYTHMWHLAQGTTTETPSIKQTIHSTEIPESFTVDITTGISSTEDTTEILEISSKKSLSPSKPAQSVTKTSQPSIANDSRNVSTVTPLSTTDSRDTVFSTPNSEPPPTTETSSATPTQQAPIPKSTTLILQKPTGNPIKPTPTKAPTVKPTTSVKLGVATSHIITTQPPLAETEGNVKSTHGDTEDHKESTTESSADGGDWFNNIAHNSIISKLAMPVVLGIIAAIFIVCFAFAIRSCRKKPSRGRRKVIHNGRDHELGGNFDRMKLLADSSEDEF